jgi:hypothetical protein
MRADVWIWKEAACLSEVRATYDEWIRRTTGLKEEPIRVLTFDGVTHAEQLSVGPVPSVRIALVNREGPQPVIEPAWLKLCRPVEAESVESG